MTTSIPHFMPGDRVYYTGKKFQDRLGGKPGWIHAPVNNNLDAFVVEFPDTRNTKDPTDTDDYVMHYTHLTDRRPPTAEKKQDGPEVQPRRRAKRPDEE